MEYDSQNEMTLVKSARFELPADNSLPGSDSSPKIILFCTGGKLKSSRLSSECNDCTAKPSRLLGAAANGGHCPRGQLP